MKLINFIFPEKKKNIYLIIIFVAVFSLIAGFGIINIKLDTDVSVMLPSNAETAMEREKINRLGKEFASDQLLFVAVTGDPFSTKNIENLWKLCNDIDKLDSVKSTLNPFNSTYFSKLGSTFSINRMNMRTYPKTEEQITAFIDKITSNRFLIGSVISFDHKTAGIVVRMNEKAMMGKDIENKGFIIRSLEFLFGTHYGKTKIDRSYFCSEVESVIKKYDKDLSIHIAGVPVYEAKGKEYMGRDMFILLVPAILLMVIIIFLNFRTKRGTVLPLLTILLGLLCTMGMVGWMRYKLSIIGVILPPLIITLGSSYAMYYMESYYTLAHKINDPRKLVINSFKEIWFVIFLAGFTTILGFAACLTSVTVPIFYYGLFNIIGTAITMYFAYALVPNMLQLMPTPKSKKVEELKSDIFSRTFDRLIAFVIPLRYLWISLFFASVVLCIIVIPQIKVETDATRYFKDSGDLRKGIVLIQKNFHGTVFYNITLRSVTHQKNFFKTREGLLSAKKIQDYFDRNVIIDGHTMIGCILSPVTLVQDFNNNINGKLDIPEDEEMLKKFLSFLKASNDDGIKSILNNDFSAINFQVRLFSDNKKNDFLLSEQESAQLKKKLDVDLDRIAREDGNFTIEMWGEILLLSNISKYLLNDQIWNLSAAVILVFVLMVIVLRSIYFSLIGLVPIIFAIIMNYAIMPIFNIPLDAATVMISSIAVGVGINNSIFFVLFYMKNIKSGKDMKQAITDTLRSTYRPIFFTAIALVLGFIVFLLSSFKPVIYFGLLIAIAMITCTFATLFIMPAMFALTDRFRIFSQGVFNKLLRRNTSTPKG